MKPNAALIRFHQKHCCNVPINSFKVFDQMYMITQGGPGTSTLVLVMHIYNVAFKNWDLGYASAISMVLFLLVLIVTIVQFRGEKKFVNY